MKQLIFFCLFLAIGLIAKAQSEMGLHFIRNAPQAARTNPALLPSDGVIITLPNFMNALEVSGPSFGELIGKNDAGETIIDIDKALPELEAENTLRENLDIETVGVIFGKGPVRFNFYHALRFGAFIKYPKTLPQVIWQGNSQFIGQEIDLSNDLQLVGFNEFGLGASFKFSVVTVGGRIKLLSGIGDVSTDRNEASLYTSDDVYQLELNADYRANTASYLEYNGFEDSRLEVDFGSFEFDDLFTKNTGFAFDLGASVDIGKLNFTASVLDIGKIKWSDNARNYSSQGSFYYDGLDISQALGGDSSSIGDALDTLEQIFQVVETSDEYSTELPVRIYASASYRFSDSWTFGAAYYHELYREENFQAISLSARKEILPWISAGANYSIINDNYFNIGLNTVIKAGPVQVLGITDNILAVFDPDNANFASVRLGLNLIFQ